MKAQNLYRIYCIKSCYGDPLDRFSSSTNDLNQAYQRIAKRQAMIDKTKRCVSSYWSCRRDAKCKAQFEVRELNDKPSKKTR